MQRTGAREFFWQAALKLRHMESARIGVRTAVGAV